MNPSQYPLSPIHPQNDSSDIRDQSALYHSNQSPYSNPYSASSSAGQNPHLTVGVPLPSITSETQHGGGGGTRLEFAVDERVGAISMASCTSSAMSSFDGDHHLGDDEEEGKFPKMSF